MRKKLFIFFSFITLSIGATTLNCKHVAPADSGKLAKEVQLENVVVYGSRNNFGVKSSQMSAVSLNQKQIMAVPVFFGEADVLKSLQKFPGVQSGTEGTAGVFVRGGDYDQNYITLDGSAIYNAEHLQGYVSAINPDVVQNINFYRGAFPARYGSRLSSVIDVGIKEGDFNKYHGLLSLGMLSGRMQAEGPIWKGHTSFNVAARMSYFNLIAKPILKHYYDRPAALQPYSNMGYYDITAKVVHKFNEQKRFSVLFYYGNDTNNESPTQNYKYENTIDDPRVLTSMQSCEEDYRSTTNESKWNNLLTSIYYTTFFNSNHRLNININYSQYLYDLSIKNTIDDKINDLYRLYYSRNEKNSITSHSGIKDLALTADALFSIGNAHDLRYGLKLSRQWLAPYTKVFKDSEIQRFAGGLNYDGDVSLLDPQYKITQEHVDYKSGEELYINNLTLYAEDDFSIFSKLKLNYGVRLGMYQVTGKSYFAAEPRVSLRFLATDKLSFKASYSNMTQGIHRLVTNNLVMPSDIWVPITKDIPLMKSNLYGLGLNYDICGFNIAAEGYYKTLDNVLEYRNGATYFVNDQNWQEIVALGKGRSYGVELLIEKKIGKTTGWLSYTWSKALRKFDRPGDELNGGKEFYASTDRRNNISLNINHHFTISKKVAMDISASWSYQTGRRGTVPYAITYGQSFGENYGSIPVIVNGETLEYVMGWRTSMGVDIYGERLNNISGVAPAFHSFRNINDFKLPDTHHLDVNCNLSIKHIIGETIFGLGVYNVYNHYNISNVYIGYSNNQAVLKGICPFPFMPSISITQKF